MADRTCPAGMTAEQFEEAQRLYEVTESALAEERWRMCCLLAGKQDGQRLGQAEFELRQHLLKMGAATLEAAVNQRRKKGDPGSSIACDCGHHARFSRVSPKPASKRSKQ